MRLFIQTKDSLFAITSSTTKRPTREETRFHPLVYSNAKSTFGPEKRGKKERERERGEGRKRKRSGKKKIEGKDKKRNAARN